MRSFLSNSAEFVLDACEATLMLAATCILVLMLLGVGAGVLVWALT